MNCSLEFYYTKVVDNHYYAHYKNICFGMNDFQYSLINTYRSVLEKKNEKSYLKKMGPDSKRGERISTWVKIKQA